MSEEGYRLLGPDEEVMPGDEIAWSKDDLDLPESWTVVTGSTGLFPRNHENYRWRRRIFCELKDL